MVCHQRLAAGRALALHSRRRAAAAALAALRDGARKRRLEHGCEELAALFRLRGAWGRWGWCTARPPALRARGPGQLNARHAGRRGRPPGDVNLRLRWRTALCCRCAGSWLAAGSQRRGAARCRPPRPCTATGWRPRPCSSCGRRRGGAGRAGRLRGSSRRWRGGRGWAARFSAGGWAPRAAGPSSWRRRTGGGRPGGRPCCGGGRRPGPRLGWSGCRCGCLPPRPCSRCCRRL
jgi:hypothetical protein